MKLVISVALASSITLAACSQSNDPVYTQFYREAGALTDTGEFGNSTANNALAMTNPEQYAYDLANRFASEVGTMVNFAFNSTVLDAGARDILLEQANWIRQFPEVRFRVYGHTDLVGSPSYNKRLGLARAKTVVNFLVAQGISRSRLEAVASFGETQPLIATQGRERRNRRTVTEVRGFVKSNPLVLDGKYAQIIYRDYVQSAQAPTQLTGLTGDAAGSDE